MAHPKLLRALGTISLASGALLLTGTLPAFAATTIVASSSGTVVTDLGNLPVSVGQSSGLLVTNTDVYIADGPSGVVRDFSRDGLTNKGDIALPTGSFPVGLALSPDGTHLFVTLDQTPGFVADVTLANPSATPPIFAVGNGPFSIALSPDGATAYVFSNSNQFLSSYLVSNGALQHSSPGGIYTTGGTIRLSPDGSKVYLTYRDPVGGGTTGGLLILNASDLTQITHVDLPNAESLAVTPAGNVIVGSSTGGVGTLTEFSATGVPTGRSVTMGSVPRAAVLSPDGGTVFEVDQSSGNLFGLRLSDFTLDGPLGSIQADSLAITPDGTELYSNGGTNAITSHVAIAKLTLTAPATVTPGTGPTAFATQITDGQTPVDDYSAGTVLVEILDSTNTVVASASASPDPSTGAAAPVVDLSTLPVGTYSVRATLTASGGSVAVLASGFTVAAAAPTLAATGVDAGAFGAGLAAAVGMLLLGVALVSVRRRRTAR